MTQDKLLHLLFASEGEYVSGEEMSTVLGVSRSAVWKGISSLRSAGYVIDSKPNRGYCLFKSPYGMESAKLSQLLKGDLFGSQISCVASIDSTNSEVKRQATQGVEEGLLVVADHQTAGRGRRGREFHSPAGQGLYFSMLLRPSGTYEEWMDFTAWVAVALCRGIASFCGISPEIKWTNDIVWQGKKLCGILTELALESESNFVEYVVLGVGVNVQQQERDFPEELQDIATSLGLATGREVNRAALCAHLVMCISQMYSCFPREKQAYLQDYRKYCVTIGKEVQVLFGEERRCGRAVDIDDNFRLLVDYQGGERGVLSTGEVSVRGMYGYI